MSRWKHRAQIAEMRADNLEKLEIARVKEAHEDRDNRFPGETLPYKKKVPEQIPEDFPRPDCACVIVIPAEMQHPGHHPGQTLRRWGKYSVISKTDCPQCGGEGYRRKPMVKPYECGPEVYVPQGTKPLRLLVEVVPKKDEKHPLDGFFMPTSSLRILSNPALDAFSVQQLPPMPSLAELWNIFLWNNEILGVQAANLTPVLKACGLEVA